MSLNSSSYFLDTSESSENFVIDFDGITNQFYLNQIGPISTVYLDGLNSIIGNLDAMLISEIDVMTISEIDQTVI